MQCDAHVGRGDDELHRLGDVGDRDLRVEHAQPLGHALGDGNGQIDHLAQPLRFQIAAAGVELGGGGGEGGDRASSIASRCSASAVS